MLQVVVTHANLLPLHISFSSPCLVASSLPCSPLLSCIFTAPQFDPSGQHLIVANQDTNTVKVFLFNMMSGSLSYTGAEFDVASPNFICCDQPERNTTSTDITIYGSSSKL